MAAAKSTHTKTAKPKAPVAAPVAAPTFERGQGIGKFCKDQISAGLSNGEVLAAVKVQFPNATTSLGSISWYRSMMKKGG